MGLRLLFCALWALAATGCQMFGFDDDNGTNPDAGALDGGGDGDAAGDGDGDAAGDGDGDGDAPGDGDAVDDCDDPDDDGYGEGTTCLGSDCDSMDSSTYEGAPELCDGADNDCDDLVDEDADAACYTGPDDTAGVGSCQAGVSFCVGGIPGPCVGAVVPGAEACNQRDDDCNGSIDDGLPTLSCGVGVCAATAASCNAGAIQQCVPGNPGSEQGNCADGLDNDCNGLVDDCLCVHVATFGDDATGDGAEGSPLRTIAAAITLAQQPGQPSRVCLGADNNGSCQWTFYGEDVVMADGIGVSGGWDTGQSPWVQRPLHGSNQGCVTEIQGQTQNTAAVTFGPLVASSTPLDNVMVSLQNPGTDSTTLLIAGSTGAIVSDSDVFGAGAGTKTVGVLITNDPNSGTAATPLITRTSVNGGAGTIGTAIHSVRSSPVIQGNCGAGQILPNGRCFQGCTSSIAIRANRFTGQNVQVPADATAILLEDSNGAVVDQNVVCGGGTNAVAGVRVIGGGKRTVISRNDIVVWGGLQNNGVHTPGCDGHAPWIFDNERIAAEGNYPAGTAIAAAVRATGDCHPLIEGNALIVGGVEGAVLETYGVLCGADPASGVASRCNVIGNTEIRGSNSNVPDLSVGVRCEAGACNVIRGNALIWGRAGIDVAGLQLVGPTSAFVDGNVIMGGCGATTSIGALAANAAARIQNNVIDAGSCAGVVPSSQWYGVRAVLGGGVNELDMHSNSILGGGAAGVACTSRGVSLDIDPLSTPPGGGLGVLRNNIIDAGSCSTRHAFEEASASADPRVFENNDLWPSGATALYRDEAATNLATATAVDNLLDMQVAQTLDVDPQWTRDPANGLYRLGAASMCRDAGTATGTPGNDFEGEHRPGGAAADIGADEAY